LDDYISAPDTNFSFQLAQTIPAQGYTTFVLALTSQSWLTTNEVDHTLWKHWVIITRPDKVKTSRSLLFISGGKNGGNLPKGPDDNLAQIAVATESIVSELKMVPNQPLVFAGETEGRVEDSLIAYTWDKFLRTGDAKWPARLPMTKSAVRAMDAVSAFCGSDDGGRVRVDGFVVAGGSKRGWTTWTTAAVDKRVIAVVPIVIDVLNVVPSMTHHYAAYGFWAPAIADYEAFRIMEWTGTTQYAALMKIEDPYTYRERLTMPKFILNASGDQFFVPDSSQFYFSELPGTKYLRYIPNADHSLKGSDAYQTLLACYQAVVYNKPLPRFSWVTDKTGTFEIKAEDHPSQLALWQSTNSEARDFRLEVLGPKWTSTSLSANGDGAYTGKVEKPAKGWTAFFVELTFPSGIDAAPFKFTTPVQVIPDTVLHKFETKGPPN
jgi:PhoPQ-activated pathogenicity-related protein